MQHAGRLFQQDDVLFESLIELLAAWKHWNPESKDVFSRERECIAASTCSHGSSFLGPPSTPTTTSFVIYVCFLIVASFFFRGFPLAPTTGLG